MGTNLIGEALEMLVPQELQDNPAGRILFHREAASMRWPTPFVHVAANRLATGSWKSKTSREEYLFAVRRLSLVFLWRDPTDTSSAEGAGTPAFPECNCCLIVMLSLFCLWYAFCQSSNSWRSPSSSKSTNMSRRKQTPMDLPHLHTSRPECLEALCPWHLSLCAA